MGYAMNNTGGCRPEESCLTIAASLSLWLLKRRTATEFPEFTSTSTSMLFGRVSLSIAVPTTEARDADDNFRKLIIKAIYTTLYLCYEIRAQIKGTV